MSESATGIPFHRVSGGINTDMVVANKIFVIDAGYINQIREGNIANHTYICINGNNLNLGTANEEISDLGTVGFGNWPSAALGAILVSDSAEDAAAQTGALTVIVRGLDADYALASETVTMTGVTPATITTQTFLRIHELEVVTAGTALGNVGTITASIDGNDIIALLPGHGRSMSGRWTVPAGNTLYLQNPEGATINGKDTAFHLFIRDSDTANSPFLLIKVWGTKDAGYMPNGKLQAIPEKYDIVFIGEGELAGSIATASVEGWYESN
jgi:hypothetical protein